MEFLKNNKLMVEEGGFVCVLAGGGGRVGAGGVAKYYIFLGNFCLK